MKPIKGLEVKFTVIYLKYIKNCTKNLLRWFQKYKLSDRIERMVLFTETLTKFNDGKLADDIYPVLRANPASKA